MGYLEVISPGPDKDNLKSCFHYEISMLSSDRIFGSHLQHPLRGQHDSAQTVEENLVI